MYPRTDGVYPGVGVGLYSKPGVAVLSATYSAGRPGVYIKGDCECSKVAIAVYPSVDVEGTGV